MVGRPDTQPSVDGYGRTQETPCCSDLRDASLRKGDASPLSFNPRRHATAKYDNILGMESVCGIPEKQKKVCSPFSFLVAMIAIAIAIASLESMSGFRPLQQLLRL